MKDILIIRHGETDLNKQGVIQGRGVNPPLNETGRFQARAFYEHYRQQGFETVLTSSLLRTHQTVSHFIEEGIRWEQFPDIDEMSWGSLEGLDSSEETRTIYRNTVQQWQEGNFHARFPDGESAADLAARLQRFVDHLPERPEKRILVCSHGRAMRCLMVLLRGQNLRAMEHYQHHNTGLYWVRWDGKKFNLELENDTRHLQTAEKWI